MTDNNNAKPHMSSRGDTQVAQYQTFSALAVAGLIFGCLSAFALVDPMAWLLPLVGMLLGGVALRQIAKNGPALAGRKTALAGLMLSLVFGAAAVGQWSASRWLLENQARRFAQTWFDLLRYQQPQKAYQLTQHFNRRRPLDDTLWAYYRETPEPRRELEGYVVRPLIRTLLALGKNDQVRYYETETQSHDGRREHVSLIYAVTCDASGAKQTFFVRLRLERSATRSGGAGWRVAESEGPIRPASMPEEG